MQLKWGFALSLLSLFFAANTMAAPIYVESPDLEVEPKPYETANKICNCRYDALKPYDTRRTRWGGFFGAQATAYSPTNYQPDFHRTTSFDNYYIDNKSLLYELVFGPKFNFFWGSLSAQISAGYFNVENKTNNSKLTVIPVAGSLLWALDNIFREPYVVPYVLGGVYSAVYSEAESGLSVSGNSAFAPFFGGGAMFQLDWIDEDADIRGYQDYGLENTFLYVEARSYAAGTIGPNFSTPLQFGGGLKVEF